MKADLYNIPQFPVQARIENTNLCNATCAICPRESLSRPKGIMPFEHFEKLVRECAEKGLKELHLQGFGEPFIDKDIIRKIRFASNLGIPKLFMVTNASLINESFAEGIVTSGLHKIKVSFYGTNAEEYEAIHKPLKYETVRENIKTLARVKRRLKSKTPRIAVQYIGKWYRFPKFFLQWFRYATPQVNTLHNYGYGKKFVEVNTEKDDRLCPMVARPIMQILWDGRVVPCCYDFNAQYILGNALETSIEQIWNSPEYESFREIHRKRDFAKIPMCLNCDKLR
jgi:radical SAM protein with 4Fe4S-binding SPASM domain